MLDNSRGKSVNMVVFRNGEDINIKVTPIINKKVPIEEKYMIGIVWQPGVLGKISKLIPNYPAITAGLKADDIIKKIAGKTFTDIKSLVEVLDEAKNSGKKFSITVKRGEQMVDVELTAKLEKNNFYTIKTQLSAMDYPNPIQQFVRVIDMSYKSLRSISFWVMNKVGISKHGSTIKPSNLSGPIGMGRTIYLSIYRGTLRHGIFFIVLISFALAIFNLLPLPVLDGGHITVAGIEMITRRPLHKKSIEMLNIIFIALLISLMVYVTFYDILRFMGLKPAESEKIENWEFSNGNQQPATPEITTTPKQELEAVKKSK